MGIDHRINDAWTASAGATWTRWSSVKTLIVRFDNLSQPTDFTDFSWQNVWSYEVGLTYKPKPKWTFRIGGSYDESPVPDHTRGPRLPDGDCWWAAIGADYQATPNLKIGFNYAHLLVADGTIGLTTGGLGNSARGNLTARFRNRVDILSLGMQWTF